MGSQMLRMSLTRPELANTLNVRIEEKCIISQPESALIFVKYKELLKLCHEFWLSHERTPLAASYLKVFNFPSKLTYSI